MYGWRCQDCGEVRWSILGRGKDEPRECPACGAPMVEERRHPGRRTAAEVVAERRDAPVATA